MKKLEVVQAQRRLATHGVSEISVNQPEITGPGTAKIAARELRIDGSAQLDCGITIVNCLSSPRGRQIMGQSPDYIAHRCKG